MSPVWVEGESEQFLVRNQFNANLSEPQDSPLDQILVLPVLDLVPRL